LTVYGFTTAALAGYTRTVGHVFAPAVSLIFGLKTFFFGLVVTLIPAAVALHGHRRMRARTSIELQGLVRMLVMILLIEVASLVGNYY
jgi:phospholipid/cholesterol/gamma-HCH transport system permease protein